MNESPCFDRDYYLDLLDGRLPPEDEPRVRAHLEDCEPCRETLEALATERDGRFPGAPDVARPGPTEPALLAAVAALEKLAAADDSGTEEVEDAAADLSFLAPADKPGLLGRLGEYEVLEVIGRGGMSVVFKAFDPTLHRVAAIKVLAPQMAGSAVARRRFLREGRAAAAVVHDHVITIYNVDEKDGLPYLVMQYVAGVSLQDKLDRDGPLPLLEILRIGMQAAAGLAAAHARGLIHRDIKPANILLENGVERVKITDFGLARAVDDDSCTRAGFVAGTPAYMAPEQARGEPPDPRADLFSLGSVLFALCTGEPPFRASSSLATLRRVADEAPPSVRTLNPEVPDWLEEIVTKLHAADPAERFGSAAEVASLLERHLAHQQQPAAMPKPPPLAEARPPRRPRLRRWLCAAAVALAVVAVFGASEATGVTQVVQAVAMALRISTPYGTLVVETDDPDVKVKVDGEDVVVTGGGAQEVRVKAGQHHFQAVKDGVPVRDELISITRGGKQVVKVSLESPAAAAPVAAAPKPADPAPLSTGGVVLRTSRAVWSWADGAGAGASCGAMSSDGKTVVSGSWNGTVRVWDVESRKELMTIPGLASGLRGLALSPDNQTLATGATDLMVRLWDMASGKPRQSLGGYSGRIMALAYSPDGKTLASAGGDFSRAGELKLWDVATGKERTTVAPFARSLWGVAFSPDGKSVAVAVGDGTAQIVDVATGKLKVTFTHPSYARRVAYSPDGKVLAVSYSDQGFVALWDLETNKQRAVFQAHATALHGLSFSPNGTQLLTAGADGTAVVWNVGTSRVEPALTLKGHEVPVTFALFSPDGRTVATGGGNDSDRTVRLWDVEPHDGVGPHD